MRLREQLGGRMIFMDLSSEGPEEALREIASRLKPVCSCGGAGELERGLVSWFQSGSPGVAGGVAFPHARCAGINGCSLCIGRSREGIDFGVGGEPPVRVVAALLSPAGEHSRHLSVLARMARLLSRGPAFERLIQAGGPSDMERVLEEEDEAASRSDVPDAGQ
jgi:mannitol/fructose-specific phosphotransferase system IIA component (Ntr-type)